MSYQAVVTVLLLVILSGCAARPLYRHESNTGEEGFEEKLAYSRNLFSQPIDILEADSGFVHARNAGLSDSSGSGGDLQTQLLPAQRGAFAVQIASFKNRRNANNSRIDAQQQYPDLPVSLLQHRGYWRVVIGFYDDRAAAQQILQRLQSAGRRDAWIFKP